jgi:hypothetical protein
VFVPCLFLYFLTINKEPTTKIIPPNVPAKTELTIIPVLVLFCVSTGEAIGEAEGAGAAGVGTEVEVEEVDTAGTEAGVDSDVDGGV